MTTKKSYDIQFKALPGEGKDAGMFEALVSIYGNVDSMGDRVVKGAFAKSIETWKASGDQVPVIWSHDWGNPFAHIGSADPNLMEETDQGLKVIGQIDLTNAFGAQVFQLMKKRSVKEFSFGYIINKESTAKDGANNLEELDILEIGPTLKGANPDTQLLGVKAELEAAARPEFKELQSAFAALKAEFEALRNVVTETAEGTSLKADDLEAGKADEVDPDADLKMALLRLSANADIL